MSDNTGLKPSSSDSKSFLNSLKGDIANSTSKSDTPKENSTQNVKTENAKSIIGHGIQFRGELIGKEDLHIEGRVEGTVIMEGQNLTIGTQGQLDANIHVQNIVINGKLTGDVLADELIEIKNTAVVKGNLIAPRIQLEDGGKFRGSMDMVDNAEEQTERKEAFKEKLIHPDLPNKNKNPQNSYVPQQQNLPNKKDNKQTDNNKPFNKQ